MNRPVRTSTPTPQLIAVTQPGLAPKQRLKRWLLWGGLAVVSAIVGTLAAFGVWYTIQLTPVDEQSNQLVPVVIEPGMSPNAIGELLEKEGLIRNDLAFALYTRLHGVRNKLQAGTYRLSPAESVAQIVGHITSGRVDEFRLTFYPGATLADATNRSDAQKTDVTSVLVRAGYSRQEIEAALAKTYNHPLFAGKPAQADLEGYVYGETYQFAAGASVEAILSRTFDEFYGVIERHGLEEAFAARGLSLYQGITLASIIQREAVGGDEAQIAQVFYSRLSLGMPLGSDVTYQYIADKTGVARDPNLDSPYNTRRYTGLPPGPIAAPGLVALQAVATPAQGDYLYFLSGDDNITYFARTLEEHQQNIVQHCQQKCLIL